MANARLYVRHPPNASHKTSCLLTVLNLTRWNCSCHATASDLYHGERTRDRIHDTCEQVARFTFFQKYVKVNVCHTLNQCITANYLRSF